MTACSRNVRCSTVGDQEKVQTEHELRPVVFRESTTVQSKEDELSLDSYSAVSSAFIGQMVILVSQQDRESILN